MAFSAITGKSVRLADGQLQTHVIVTNDANGNTFEDDLSYAPGATLAETKANLETRVRAAIDLAKAQTKAAPMLPAGTVLDLTPPSAVVPPPPTQEQQDRGAYFTAKRKYYVLLDLKAHNRTGVTQQQVDDALVAWNALRFDPVWEEVA
jgi:hypothetical protein